MKTEPIQIVIYNKREGVTAAASVEQLSENKFRMIENSISVCLLTLGTEFETRINKEDKHEVIRITKKSSFITRRFFLSTNHTESDYLMLGEELVKRGGFWQVVLGGLVIVNIPQDFEYDIDELIKELDIRLTEVTAE